MAYNIGEKPGQGSYLCPNCGCRAGEMTMLARLGVSSLGRETKPPTNVSESRNTYTVKSSRSPFATLKAATRLIVFAGLMFASGFATKTLLLPRASIESTSSSGTNPGSGDSSLNVNTGKVGDSIDASVSVGNPNATVWVNTNSGVYHCSNTRWYGNTKSGQYMTQKEAQSKGYRPAHGSACG